MCLNLLNTLEIRKKKKKSHATNLVLRVRQVGFAVEAPDTRIKRLCL